MLEALINTFAQLEDPRCDWRVEHKLLDILVIAVCAVIGEAESFEDIALYGRCKRDWLQRFLELRGGIPSHDTFRRVLMLVDPERFERCFLDWVRSVFQPDTTAPRQIAIDGKTVRGSFGRRNGRSPLHLVSAFAVEHGLVLAQRATDAKRGELSVLPDLLDGLDLRGCPSQAAVAASVPAGADDRRWRSWSAWMHSPADPRLPGRLPTVAVTICWPSRAIRPRHMPKCGVGSRPTPSRWEAPYGLAAMPSRMATADGCAGASSPAPSSSLWPPSSGGGV